MDKLTLLGLLVALVGIMTGQILEGSDFSILFQGAAFLIVFGGTLGAVMVQSPRKVFLLSIKMGRWAFVPPKSDEREVIRQLVEWAALTRREGMLAMEARLSGITDPFLLKGAQLLVDGHSAAEIREVLEIDTQSWEQLRWQAARVWEAAAGYSPTVGIIGAVLGLMHVMQNLAEPGKLGSGIAVAFVATIYGVAFANLLFLPIANKLKAIIMQQTQLRDLIVDGLGAIANSENPRLIEIKLQGYLD
ncbi:MAG: flagellar motor protein [Gallionellaceae bacterium CG1_02_56_997]|nr:MAG: flagellar motor protein [Gallionellaceae bacterium CG1_02_56_997]PIX04641.1 MAG: flagellar motor protein [Gallionellales bacterium CG_4_8_14_3_um_filter_54_18]PJC04551.1 MAG: flagellar motor protein [Gallionellales bacterium CG_4_9_14_0_8_um_filter_55_61]HCJ50359.1 flagellar motor protein [Gallionella sp.]